MSELEKCYDCGKLTKPPKKKGYLTLCPDCLKREQQDPANFAPDFTISELNRGADIL